MLIKGCRKSALLAPRTVPANYADHPHDVTMALLLSTVSSSSLLPVSKLPKALQAQLPKAVQAQMPEAAPAHLTGALAADAGFDPLLLAALANKPVQDLLPFVGRMPSMTQREIILANQSPEQQLASVQWMREAEVPTLARHNRSPRPP